jgi:single-strand DNA-binding protein
MENKKIELLNGRLGNDPMLAYTKNGLPICELSLAIKGAENSTIWRKIVAFGKLAEQCKVHLKKGQEIFVQGPVFLKSYTNKEGQEKEYWELNANSIGSSLL